MTEALQQENMELRRLLKESEETLRAIREGAVDAFVVQESGADRVYTLEGADRPYRLLVEQMQQGALTLYTDGSISYANLRARHCFRSRTPAYRGAPLGLRDAHECVPLSSAARDGPAVSAEG